MTIRTRVALNVQMLLATIMRSGHSPRAVRKTTVGTGNLWEYLYMPHRGHHNRPANPFGFKARARKVRRLVDWPAKGQLIEA